MSDSSNSESKRLKRWQRITLSSLIVGYAGYYFCRTNFSVATPLLLDAFGDQGLDKEMIGMIASVGVLFYAVGKIFNGILCDFVGGRRMFLFGMVGSIAATILFGMGVGIGVFVIAWSINRLVQSMGWGALVKITSNWFPFGKYGRVMGLLSLSFLFGDVVARFVLGGLISGGVGWRGVFYASAAILGLIALVDFFTLRSSPLDIGEPEPRVNPHNVFGEKGEASRPDNLKDLLRPFLSNFGFWMVAAMSLGLTLIRESFTFWTPTYLAEVGGMSAGTAGQYSLLFPLFGGISVLVFGYLADRIGGGKRAVAILIGLVPLFFVLIGMGVLKTVIGGILPLVLVSLAGMLLIGPYSFLAGAMSLDLGGKRGSSTAAGLIDSAGYFGGIVSGWGVGFVAQRSGWDVVFILLAGVAAFTIVAAVLYWWSMEREDPGKNAVETRR